MGKASYDNEFKLGEVTLPFAVSIFLLLVWWACASVPD